MKKNKLIAAVLGLALTVTATTMSFTTNAFAAKDKDQYAGVGSYKAFGIMQTSTWIYRDAFDTDSSGFKNKDYNSVMNSTSKKPTKTKVIDTQIDGDGDYVIAFKDLDLAESKDFNMLGISTNIALDSKIKITAASASYDGTELTSEFKQKNDDKKYVHLMFINQYDDTMKDKVKNNVPADGSTIIMKFTVSGFGYEKKVKDSAEISTATATPAPTPNLPEDKSDVTVAPKTPAAQTTSADSNDGGSNVGIIIGVVAAVVVVAGVVVVVVVRKRKN
ncbi:MAG: hypothetical protein Q4G58_02960 [bacterium]|nr:hypothetical protein [bacterium]